MDSGKKVKMSEGSGMGEWVNPVKGIKEGMHCIEHCVLFFVPFF